MASITWNPGINSVNPTVTLEVTQTSQSQVNNTSTVSWRLYMSRPSKIVSSASKAYTVTIDGTQVASGSVLIGGSGQLNIASGTRTISHNSEGVKSITFAFTQAVGITWSGRATGNASRSGSMSLTTIHRASTLNSFSIANALNSGTANTVNLSISRANSGFTHDIQLRIGSVTIATWNGAGVPTSLSLTAAHVNSLLSNMSTVTSATVTLRVQTKSGSSNIGSVLTRTATATVHANVKPTASGLTAAISGSGRDKTINKYVKGISRVAASFTSAAIGGATVSSRTITIDGKAYSGASVTSDILNKSGTISISATIKDSRGRTTTTPAISITVQNYSNPNITTFKGSRLTVNNNKIIRVTRAATHTRFSDNTNPLTVKIEVRIGIGAWVSLENLTVATSVLDGTTDMSNANDGYSYEFRLTVTDSFGRQAQAIFSMGTLKKALSIRKNQGIGVGKIHEGLVTLEVDGGVQGRLVSPYFKGTGTSGRQTSLNVPIVGDQSLTPMIVTSSVIEGKTGLPNTGEGYLLHFEWDTTAGWGLQLWFSSASNYGKMYARAQQGSNTWSAWKEVGGGTANSIAWANVTGKPTTFPPASHTHSYLPLSGGTLTGTTKVGNLLEIINKSVSNRFIIDNLAGAFNDATIRPPSNNTCNIGSNSYKISYGGFTTLAGSSDRAHKEEIQTYDTSYAYEQLKDMPMYTFTFKHDQFVDHNIGTMIDYMPIDMLETSRGENEELGRVDTYSVNNAIFFTMAVAQEAQKKIDILEKENQELLTRLERLEDILLGGGY